MTGEYTPRAAWVLAQANQEALRFNHEYIGTDHILLALVKDGSGVAVNVLKNLDIDLRRIRLEIERIVQYGPGGEQVVVGRLPHTPRAQKVIEYAAEAARELDQESVGPEHLLLGLVREEEGAAAQVLLNLGADVGRVEAEVYRRRPAPWSWRTSDVIALVRGIAADEAYDRLPILADALQDAGCDDPEVLGHLRRGTDHGCRASGCWVLDRLLTDEQRDSGVPLGTEQEASGGRPRGRRWWRFWG